MGEALDVVRFTQRYWDPAADANGKVIRPGLSAAVGNGRFHAGIAQELHELYEAAQDAQTEYHLSKQTQQSAPSERAAFVLAEIRATLEWCFDDGENTDADAQLESLAQEHNGAGSQDDVAAALMDYAALAERHQTHIDGLGGFGLEMIAEARSLAQALRERSAGPAAFDPRPGQQDLLQLRNRLATMLYDRMLQVRAAVRFVFRHHPKLVREVSSSYKRTQRAAQRRRKSTTEPIAPADPTTTTQIPPGVVLEGGA